MNIILQRTASIVLSLGLILGTYKGFVALFDDNTPQPRQIFPYKTESLPIEDQEKLNRGIPVRSEKALQHILEDYMS